MFIEQEIELGTQGMMLFTTSGCCERDAKTDPSIVGLKSILQQRASCVDRIGFLKSYKRWT